MTGMDDGAKILVVEDDSTIRTILGMALDGAGFKNVSMAGRGDDGLDVARREKPDLVLLDLMLPGLDGFTVAKRIRETPELSGTRIIMLTARTQSDDIVRGLECGADDYVTKPFDRKVLLARVRAVPDGRRVQAPCEARGAPRAHLRAPCGRAHRRRAGRQPPPQARALGRAHRDSPGGRLPCFVIRSG